MIKASVQKIILIYFSIARFFAKKSCPSNSVAILSFHKLGDTVFTIPAIEILVNKYQNNLVVFCFPESKIIYEKFFSNINFIQIPLNDFRKKRFAKKNIIKKIKFVNPVKIYDITGTIQTASMIYKFKGIDISGFENYPFNKLYTKTISKRKEPNLPEMYVDVVSEKDQKFIIDANYFKTKINNSDLILIDPFAGWKAKEWGIENFISLAKKIKDKYNPIFIFKENLEFLKEKLLQEKINFVQAENLEQLFYYIEKSLIFFGNDSGPAHIARALGKPTFTIYGPTNPNYTFPENEFHYKYLKGISCSPSENQKICSKDGGRKGCNNFRCLNEITVNEIYSSLKSFLKIIKAKQFTHALEK